MSGLTDGDLRALLRQLVVPGIVDIHVHAMPEPMMAAVWRVFDHAEEVYGAPWPIRYRGSDDERREHLAGIGVAAHTSLCYAHRPGVAAGLNDWTLAYAARFPQVVPSATCYPEPGAAQYMVSAVERGARVCKVHVEVGDFDINDPMLDEVWGLLRDAGVVLLAHIGSAPLPGRFTGPQHLERLLVRFPGLRVVVAHLGVPETGQFLALAERFPAIAFDTTMVGTAYMERRWPLPPRLLPQIRDLGLRGRILFGSDYPNIPYLYAHQVAALLRWDLGEEWLREVLWGNGSRWFLDRAAGE